MIGAGPTEVRLASALWALLTAVLLLLPGSVLEPGRTLPSRLEEAVELTVHFVLFFVLAWLVARARGDAAAGAGARVTVAVIVAYCTALEFLQILVPNRGFELLDIAFGWLGIWAGWRRARAAADR